MVRLAREVSIHVVSEFGAEEMDGYQRYHHAFFFTPSGAWCVVQQGMNDDTGMARRYHWLSAAVRSYVNEPHAAVCAEAEAPTLNLVADESEPVRGSSAELSRQDPSVVLTALRTRFSFAHGGKDGFPYPVDRETYDRTVEVLRSAVNRAGIDRSERVQALERLVRFGEERVRARLAESDPAPKDA